MFGIIVVLAILALIATLIAFGATADTRQPGRRWYPAGPDLKS